MVWELIGAVVGAGLASGREIATFFSRYGWMSFVGICITGLTLVYLATVPQPINWSRRWLGMLWQGMLTAMLIVTGGAMLAGAGEIGRMLLPIKAAELFTQLVSLLLAWLLANRYGKGLAAVSKLMLLVLGGMIFALLLIPSGEAIVVTSSRPAIGLLSGFMYGGFNAALQVPVLCAQPINGRTKRNSICASILLCMMLALGNIAILRNPLLLTESMPFLAAVRPWGRWGYLLYAAGLYLAILSTLTACLKGIHSPLAVVCLVLVAQLSFAGVVDALYPILGGGCFILLVCAKFSKTGSKSFHSRHDVV